MIRENSYSLRKVRTLKHEDLGALVNLGSGRYEPLLSVEMTMQGYRLHTASDSREFHAQGKIMLWSPGGARMMERVGV